MKIHCLYYLIIKKKKVLHSIDGLADIDSVTTELMSLIKNEIDIVDLSVKVNIIAVFVLFVIKK